MGQILRVRHGGGGGASSDTTQSREPDGIGRLIRNQPEDNGEGTQAQSCDRCVNGPKEAPGSSDVRRGGGCSCILGHTILIPDSL